MIQNVSLAITLLNMRKLSKKEVSSIRILLTTIGHCEWLDRWWKITGILFLSCCSYWICLFGCHSRSKRLHHSSVVVSHNEWSEFNIQQCQYFSHNGHLQAYTQRRQHEGAHDCWKVGLRTLSTQQLEILPFTIHFRVGVVLVVGVGVGLIPVVQLIQGDQLFVYIQSITSYFSPPIAAIYLVAILWKRSNEHVSYKYMSFFICLCYLNLR